MSLHHQMFLQTLRDLNALSANQQLAYQAGLLERLLDHTHRHVSGQTARLAPVAVTGRIDLDHWCTIRPITREEMNTPAFSTATVPKGAEPIDPTATPPHSRTAIAASDCVFELGLERHNVVFGLPLLDLCATQTALKKPASWNSSIAKATRATTCDDPALLNTLWHVRARPDDLETLADTPLAGLWLNTPHLPADKRINLSNRFQATPVCIWSPDDLGTIAVETRPGLMRYELGTHVLEVTDPMGRAVGCDTPGELLLTCLYDYATPVIRLRTGLQAVMKDPHHFCFS